MLDKMGLATQLLIEKPEDAPRRVSLEIARDFAPMFAIAGFVFVISTAGFAYIVTASMPTWAIVTAGAAVSVAVVFAGFVIWCALRAQAGLTAIVSEFVKWHETGRRIQEQKALVQLVQSAQTVSMPVPVATTDHRLVYTSGTPVPPPQKLLNGVPEADYAYFIDHLSSVGWTERAWLRRTKEPFPSGRVFRNAKDYAKFLEPFEQAGFLRDRRPGAAGEWTVSDPEVLKSHFGIGSRTG